MERKGLVIRGGKRRPSKSQSFILQFATKRNQSNNTFVISDGDLTVIIFFHYRTPMLPYSIYVRSDGALIEIIKKEKNGEERDDCKGRKGDHPKIKTPSYSL